MGQGIGVGIATPVGSQIGRCQLQEHRSGRAKLAIYISSGIILDIYPIIRADNIELQINQQLSNFIPTTTGVNNSPTLIKRELSSVVNSEDNDIIVLGGLEETTNNKAKNGFKWLPDFLKNNSDNQSKSDILLVLHVTKL